MQRKIMLTLTCVLALFTVYGCNDHDRPSDQISTLNVDSNPYSCSSIADDGSNVVVGTGQTGDAAFPEPASGYRLGLKTKYSDRYMVVANTPLATKAGCDVLKAGGSAVDAAIAVQAVLGLVEPQSSTIAGSAFILYYDAASQKVSAYDGRETAPAAATEYYLLRQDQADAGSAAPVPSARRSGRSIGVPGVMRMFEMAHDEHGRLAWNQLFDNAIDLSANGFKIPGRLADAIQANADALALDKNAMQTYFDVDAKPLKLGDTLKNAAYAETLRKISTQGADALYQGQIASDIIARVAQSVGDDAAATPITPGLMTLEDLKNYKAVRREAICDTYRNTYYICTMPPPSSGGVAVAQTLGILENFDLTPYAPTQTENEGGIPSVMGVHLVAEAERLAYADRDQYVADTDFVPLPGRGIADLLNKNYLKQRAALIAPEKSMGTAQAGNFNSVAGKDTTVEHGTTQFTIVDAYGNVASVTSTVESSMGSFHMVDGFLLSNQLTDFSASPVDATGAMIANRVQANKRPRSTMAPTLVFKGTQPGDFYVATGSPGGGTIIQFLVKTLVGMLDWQLDAQQATSLVNFGAMNNATTNVDGSNTTLDLAELVKGLQEKGHVVNLNPQSSGVSTIMKTLKDNQTRYAGGVDPRREGLVLGNGAL
ncbi:gamma-glutamyltransferase family protein [Acinetobacter sp. WZC-1]|uniref:gamma-glutamyltransferase family protein n=1 Tax=Acinetobacter sp. WZC-1 TaxID=3459034 RepID=UPI00403D5A3E